MYLYFSQPCKVHAGNGYLIDQFLKDNSNLRTDEYGGSLPNRFRLLREIVTACQDAIGKDKVYRAIQRRGCMVKSLRSSRGVEYLTRKHDLEGISSRKRTNISKAMLNGF